MIEFRRKKDENDDPELCSVKGCDLPFKRKLSGKAVTKAIPDIQWKTKDPRKIRLCKDHYKDYKKAIKEDRKLDRMTWDR